MIDLGPAKDHMEDVSGNDDLLINSAHSILLYRYLSVFESLRGVIVCIVSGVLSGFYIHKCCLLAGAS